MAKVFMTDPATGRCALFDEPVTTGDPTDPNSARNAPLNNPATNLADVYFHSDLDYMEISNYDAAKTISHALVTAAAAPGGITSTANFGWGTAIADHLLLTHGLGYIPHALVARGANLIYPGMPVQTDGLGGARYATIYCTTTEIRLYEFASTGAVDLAATNLNYEIMVFKQPPAASGSILLDYDPTSKDVTMGLGKFDSSRRYLQVVPGGSPLGLSYGRQIDLDNGGIRFGYPDGSTSDPVPAISTKLIGGIGGFGTAMGYGGSFAAATAIQVQAP